jgi:predicted enzyme related to lactoylglutathione lyase
MNPVVHFEMPYEDANRASSFYTSVFGWQMKTMGADMGNYVLANTTPTENGRPTLPGAINGGLFERKEGSPAQVPSVVIAVDDIRQSIKKVNDAGGKVLGDPMEIPGVGQYVSFTDSEGNRLSMLQATPPGGAR